MSRKFMVLVLVLFVGLLYAVSYALNKQSEPPAPSPEQIAQQKKEQEEAMKQQVKQRMEALKKQRAQMISNSGKSTLSDAQINTLARNTHMPIPTPMPDQKPGRGPTDTVIKSDWFHDHPDGATGIEQEIKVREKNARQPLKPQLTPAADNPAMQQLR